MANFHSSPEFFLNDVRALWLDIFEPGEGMNGGAAKYKVSALIEPESENLKKAKGMMLQAAQGLWQAGAINVLKQMATNNKAVRDGNTKLDDNGITRPEYADKFFISCSNKERPQVIAPKKFEGKFVTITPEGRGMVNGIDVTDKLGYEIVVPYRGCRVNLKCQMVAGKQFVGKNKEVVPNQVYCKIIAVQFLRKDEAFGAGPTSAEGFEDQEVEASGGEFGGGDDEF